MTRVRRLLSHIDVSSVLRSATLPLSFALSLLAIALGVPTIASATTFDDVTVEDLTRASDLVLLGQVEGVEVVPHGPAGQPGIHTRAFVRVEETWRGQARPVVEVWAHGGRLGNRMRVVPGQTTFRVGEHVVLFLFEAGGGLWPAGMSRGKWVVDASERSVRPVSVVAGTPGVRGVLELRDLVGRVPSPAGSVRP